MGDATVHTYIIMASCIFISENSFQNWEQGVKLFIVVDFTC